MSKKVVSDTAAQAENNGFHSVEEVQAELQRLGVSTEPMGIDSPEETTSTTRQRGIRKMQDAAARAREGSKRPARAAKKAAGSAEATPAEQPKIEDQVEAYAQEVTDQALAAPESSAPAAPESSAPAAPEPNALEDVDRIQQLVVQAINEGKARTLLGLLEKTLATKARTPRAPRQAREGSTASAVVISRDDLPDCVTPGCEHKADGRCGRGLCVGDYDLVALIVRNKSNTITWEALEAEGKVGVMGSTPRYRHPNGYPAVTLTAEQETARTQYFMGAQYVPPTSKAPKAPTFDPQAANVPF